MVQPHALQQPHRDRVRRMCREESVVLVAQDSTEIDLSFHNKIQDRGKIGDGGGRGFVQHTALAMRADGDVLGVLDQTWHNRVERDKRETAAERRLRWRESDLWPDAVRSVGPIEGVRLIHLMDRHGDCVSTFEAAREVGVDLIVRSMHDRALVEQDNPHARLRERVAALAVEACVRITIGEQRDRAGRITRRGREAKMALRWTAVTLGPTKLSTGDEPIRLRAVYLTEVDPPAEVEPVDWLLLTTLEVTGVQEALRVVEYYRHRWTIEEFHRAQKQGCKLELTQLDETADVHRLASLTAVIAVRLLQLRDLAKQTETDPQTDTPEQLQRIAPSNWIAVVGALAKIAPARLTPRQFLRTIAREGGHLGRRRDGPPGWLTLWRGWTSVAAMVEGYELAMGKRRSG